MESLQGQLLIAGSALWDGNFRRTIVLVGHHDDEGAVGVVLNRPLDVMVEEVVPELAALAPPGERLFSGGPVQPQAAVIVADFEASFSPELIAFGSVGFMPPEVDPQSADVRRARVFAGYAGWGPGQLEAELEDEGSWIIEPALEGDVFTSEPERLFERVVQRKGRDFAFLRSMPADPSLN